MNYHFIRKIKKVEKFIREHIHLKSLILKLFYQKNRLENNYK